MLEYSSHIVLELGLIFTFDCLCRAHFICWYIYVYLSSIAKMRSQYSQEGQPRHSQCTKLGHS
jgi:hypothetical protein